MIKVQLNIFAFFSLRETKSSFEKYFKSKEERECRRQVSSSINIRVHAWILRIGRVCDDDDDVL